MKSKEPLKQQPNASVEKPAPLRIRAKKAAKKVGEHTLTFAVGAVSALTGQEIINNQENKTETAQARAAEITSRIASKESVSVLRGGEAVIELESGSVKRIVNPIITEDDMVAERGTFMQEEGNPVVSVYGAGVSTPSGDKVKSVNYIQKASPDDTYYWSGLNDLRPKQGFDSFDKAFSSASNMIIDVPTKLPEPKREYLDENHLLEVPPPPQDLMRESPDYFLSNSAREEELARGIEQSPH